jgi:alkanesulfonate monooxygenase
MIKIFTTDYPFGNAKTQDMASLLARGAQWDQSEALDAILVGYSSIWPHNLATSPYLLALTKKIGLIVAHRPGVMHPAAAARYFATLDALSGGNRLLVNLVSGSSEKDIQREGDYSDRLTRWDRATEYVELMKRAWSQPDSFDHSGAFYKAEGVRQMVRPPKGHIPILMGGDSDAAVVFGAQHADMYMLLGEPLSGTRERIEKVKEAARKYLRPPDFSVSLRLFIGETDEAAWAKANEAKQIIQEAQGTNRFLRATATDKSVGRERQLATAEQEMHDDCFWTGLVKLLGGFANTAALVGTPDRVIASLKKYCDLGVGAFLVTTGVDGFWDASLEPFLLRMKKEL